MGATINWPSDRRTARAGCVRDGSIVAITVDGVTVIRSLDVGTYFMRTPLIGAVDVELPPQCDIAHAFRLAEDALIAGGFLSPNFKLQRP